MAHEEAKLRDSWVIGSAPGCDIQVQEITVSGRHCRLSRKGATFLVEDLGSTNGTFIGGTKLTPGVPVVIPYGTQVSLGGRADMPWPTSRARSEPDTSRRPPAPVRPPDHPNEITIGRSPESKIRIDLPIVSWKHAVIYPENGKHIIEDLGSSNGTAIGELHNRIHRAVLDPSDVVFLGSYKISAAQLISTESTVEIGESPFTKVPFRGAAMEIGRDPGCDVSLPFPMVSWHHARLTRSGQEIYVEDLNSRNGTYLDGIRIAGRVLVRPGHEIGLGSFRFQLLEGGELARRAYYGNVTIEANNIVVHASNGKRLLDPISLTVFPSELVALMGPAGAGKTTLLKALNGYTPPSQGTVLFNGANLYRYYDRFRQQMGYVPQDDIVHPQLTVRQALYFSARLRTDLNEAEIADRTNKVLDDLGIPDKLDTVIGSPENKTLSGGQRKRVNIALELITDTPVLFLDEPTSGLSSYDAESVVHLLKHLSKAGKTILTTIHQPNRQIYQQFDDLIMISRDKGDKAGAMVFFGPAYPDAIQFFNPPAAAKTAAARDELNPEMLFSGMASVSENARTETWRQRYQASSYQKEYVTNRSGKQPQSQGRTGEETARRQFGLQQWLALVRRNIFVKLRDRAQTAVLLAQAPLFALLVILVNYPLKPPSATAPEFGDLAQKLPIIHFLMVVAAVWFGCNNAARDIVGEWTVYKRERMVTLKLVPYVFSKFTVLLGLCVFQCGSMLAIVQLVCHLHGNFFQGFLVLLLASMLGAGIGLCISAVTRTTESAIALLPVVLLPVIALGGGMRPIYQMPRAGQILSLAIPSRWAFEANLLNEAAAPQWGNPKNVPDLACTLPSDQNELAQRTASTPAPPPSLVPAAAGSPVDPFLNIVSDAAEGAVPHYVITAKDSAGAQQTCRAVAGQAYPRIKPAAYAVSYRHSFKTSMLVLAGMLVALATLAIAILKWRDKEPQ
ncbi:MAG TPA: FHA domain-containing protein [Terracidiphilus sp.]|jgi:ABC-type multidrug transport system ATPase subunit/ABC-type multidrug transport system permease subunit|nr:FHA domain-containing protein [Terracidiphilus sp.]